MKNRQPNTHLLSRFLRSAQAFNMIEVTMAVAIVGVGMLAIVGMIANAVNSGRQVADDTLITNLADDMLNWSRITPYTNQTWMPGGASLTNHSEVVVTKSLDANGCFPTTDAGFSNRLWAGNSSTGNGYYRITRKPLDYGNGSYSGSDIARVLIIVEWPINPATGNPMTNSTGKVANTRYYIGQAARR